MPAEQAEAVQRQLLDQMLTQHEIRHYVLWYYTPMAWGFSSHLSPLARVYDCMDELSHFRGAPVLMGERERALLSGADVVFTGGYSLYERKRNQHDNVHAVPSSVDVAHFAQWRDPGREPADQRALGGVKIGYFGVLDERLDLELIRALSDQRPEWNFIFIGPLCKISPSDLPRAKNLHYLGPRNYSELPNYLAGWDAAILPFALNDSTRFISPTKTPEYLAAGKPVVSTPIKDVIHPYGDLNLVRVARSHMPRPFRGQNGQTPK